MTALSAEIPRIGTNMSCDDLSLPQGLRIRGGLSAARDCIARAMNCGGRHEKGFSNTVSPTQSSTVFGKRAACFCN